MNWKSLLKQDQQNGQNSRILYTQLSSAFGLNIQRQIIVDSKIQIRFVIAQKYPMICKLIAGSEQILA